MFSYLIRICRLNAFIFLLMVGGITTVSAQNPLIRVIDFSCIDCTTAQALNQLSQETGITISFNPNVFSSCPLVTISAKRLSISEVLNSILTCPNMKWKWQDQQVLIKREVKKYTIGFTLSDTSSAEMLIGALVRLKAEDGEYPFEKSTNEYGHTSFNVPQGTYQVTISLTGYNTFFTKVKVKRDQTLRYSLSTSKLLSEITVVDTSGHLNWAERGGDGALKLPLKKLINSTYPVGLADIQRLASLSAGVQGGADGVGGINIRGGNADQNLFMLDDAPVFVPAHAFGIVSVFNSDLISNAKLWKGDAPARYMGRTAGVMDIRTREGNLNSWHGGFNAGLFAGSAMLEGPIKQNKMSCLLGIRHSYLSPWLKRSGDSTLFNAPPDQIKYKFSDVNAKLNFVIDTNDRVFISCYNGNDQFETPFSLTNSRLDNIIVSENLKVGNSWGNFVSTLRWNHLFSDELFSNTILRFSQFEYRSDLNRSINSLNTNTGREDVLADYHQRYQTYIRDLSLRSDFTRHHWHNKKVRFGGSITHHTFRPGVTVLNNNQNLLILENPTLVTLLIDSLRRVEYPQQEYKNWEIEPYFEIEEELSQSFTYQAGFNSTLFFAGARPYFLINPQVRLNYKCKQLNSWVAINRMSQTIHQIGSFNSNLPFELWVPSTDRIRPQRATQLVIGSSISRKKWSFLAEAYYKQMTNVLAFVSDADVLLNGGVEDVAGWEHRSFAGKGEARGIELTVEKQVGRWTTSINYAWSKSTRQFDALNGGQPFPFRFDRRHELKVNAYWQCLSWLSVSAVWLYTSGTPITLSGSRYINNSQKEDAIIREVYVIGDINSYRLPAYHRLDLAANFTFVSKSKLRHEVQAGLYNTYDRKNVLYLQADLSAQGSNKTIAYTLFPILPVIRYAFRF
jgi:TonB-dependent Receptor Plug Domain/PEGA domain